MSDAISQPRLLGRTDVMHSGAMDDDYDDLRAWCEKMRTTWPRVNDEFLPEPDRQWASNFIDQEHYFEKNPNKGKFSWVPDILVKIFSAELSPPRMLAILRYFLGFVAELIMIDYESEHYESVIIRKMFRDAIKPTMFIAVSEPPFMSVLKPSADAEPAEAKLLENIGASIYNHIIR